MNWGFWKKITHGGSIYTKTFGGLLGLSFAVLFIFYIFLNSTVSSHHREQIAVSNLDHLRLSASSLEVTFDVMTQSMTQTMWNHDFIDYMVNPKQNDPDMNYRIIQHLKTCVRNSDLLSRAYFYSPLDDSVFQNGDSILTKDTLPDKNVLAAYEACEYVGVPNSSGTSTQVFCHNGRMFLFQELNIASHIGTLVYEINRDVVRQKLLPAGEEGGSILVFDAQYRQLFVDGSSETTLSAWPQAGHLISYENLDRLRNDSQGYYTYQSEWGWYFLLPLNSDSLSVSWCQLLALYLPLFLLLMAICVVFSWYISRVIYRPINRLMQVVAPTWKEEPAFRSSEVDILENAYSNALEKHAELHGIMDAIAPEILESMLKNLLIGKHLTQARVTEILQGIGNPISVRGRFFVIACQIFPDSGRQIDDTELNLYLLAVRNLAQQLSSPESRLYSIHTDKLTVGLICCFPESRTLSQLSQDANQIQQALRLHTEAMPFRLFCARGKFYPNLLDIRYSYREAVEKSQYQQYLYSTGEQPDQDHLDETCELVMNQELIKSRVKDIMGRATENAPTQAESLMGRVLEEIDRQTKGFEQYKQLIMIFQDEMLERVISYPLTEEDQQRLSYRRVLSPDMFTGKEELIQAVKEDARMMFRMVASYSQKSRYKYIEQAKQYVEENYMDSNLSLNSVGDQVGISASYLSELWSEVTNEKFSSYLGTLRIAKAQQLLSTTKLPIKEIGYRCGFNSAQNFIRVFKKYTGIPPGQFRDSVQ